MKPFLALITAACALLIAGRSTHDGPSAIAASVLAAAIILAIYDANDR